MAEFRQLLKAADFKPFMGKSDVLAWWTVLFNYALIAVAFALPVLWFNVITVLISLILLGNRQLGLGILMHDCVHGALFKTNALNKWVGNFLCAAPILAQFEGYRRYHLKHHAKAGTTDDPDYPNYKGYPVSRASFKRKVLRDVFGVTGLKNLYILLLMHAGTVEYDMSYQTTSGQKKPGVTGVVKNLIINLFPGVIFHSVLVAVLYAIGITWVYALWWVAYFTTFMLFSRIRNAAEHANVPDLLNADPRLHARTVYANWLERLSVAPNHVNYHLEHHWMPAIPPYRLAAFHHHIKSKGLLEDTPVLNSYGEVIRQLYGSPQVRQ